MYCYDECHSIHFQAEKEQETGGGLLRSTLGRVVDRSPSGRA
jgi:hypothetical protein